MAGGLPKQLDKQPEGQAPYGQKTPYTKSINHHYNTPFLSQNVLDFDSLKCNRMP